MVAAILEGGRVTIDVARLRELHQPMYGHTGGPCSWCREWTPCPVTELLDAYEERDRLRAALTYYAEPRNHHDAYLHTNDSYDDLKLPGSRARAALEGRK